MAEKTAANIGFENLDMQIAFHCSAVISGLKTSNLLIVSAEKVSDFKKLIKNADIAYDTLLITEKRAVILLYNPQALAKYLDNEKIKYFFKRLGYEKFLLDDILPVFKQRYKRHMSGDAKFPHEMGLLLGYPIEDVWGFMLNDGLRCLYSGCWKVYYNLSDKLDLFKRFEIAKKKITQMVADGENIANIINSYSRGDLQENQNFV